MKRIICFILAAVILLGACFTQAYAAADTPYNDSRFFEMGDYEIHYRIIEHQGTKKGSIMLLHGFLCSTYAWRNMADELSAQGYDCVLADLPNFGYSTRETADTENIDREELIKALMDYIAPEEKWIVGGHSMGGGVALNIAEETDLQALLLFCPAPQSTGPKGAEKLLTSKPVKFMMNTFFKVGTRIKPLVKIVVFAATKNWEFAKNYNVNGVTDPFLYDGIGAGMCEMLTRVRPTNLKDADKVKCPVLLVEADSDIIITAEMKEQFYEALPDAQTYLVKGGGHQCIEDHAEELSRLVVDFLQ